MFKYNLWMYFLQNSNKTIKTEFFTYIEKVKISLLVAKILYILFIFK